MDGESKKMRLKIRWCKDYSGAYVWMCRYGNIETKSSIHPQRCYDLQMKKLRSKGVDVSRIDSRFDVIDPEREGNYNEYRNSKYNTTK